MYIIAYTYEADYHCASCAEARFGRDENGDIPEDAEDNEGNTVGVLFVHQEWHEPSIDTEQILSCSDCNAELDVIEALPATDQEMYQATEAYLECAPWSSIDVLPNGENVNLDDYELSEEARDMLDADIEEFVTDNINLIRRAMEVDSVYNFAQVGHDYWLTRNGHGAGFWDRGLGKVGRELTEACKPYGSSELYLADDLKVYVQ